MGGSIDPVRTVCTSKCQPPPNVSSLTEYFYLQFALSNKLINQAQAEQAGSVYARCKGDIEQSAWLEAFQDCTVSNSLSTVYCLLSAVYCLSIVCCLLSVYCLLSTVCLLSAVYCLLSTVYCLLSTVYCLLCTDAGRLCFRDCRYGSWEKVSISIYSSTIVTLLMFTCSINPYDIRKNCDVEPLCYETKQVCLYWPLLSDITVC